MAVSPIPPGEYFPHPELGYPLIQGTSGVAAPNLDELEVWDGQPRYRNRGTQIPELHTLQFLWTPAQFDIFQYYYGTLWLQGMQWVEITIHKGSSVQYVLHFRAPPYSWSFNGIYYQVSMSMWGFRAPV